jgi:short-subunit dehydrogenase
MQYPGQTALVTGASSGIGAVYARELAARGADLILVARREDTLTALADKLSTEYGHRADVIAADLAEPGAADLVAQRVSELGRTVDILVNNAGFGAHGDLAAADPARLSAMVQLNCATVVDLTRRYLPGMLTRRRGTIINVASTAAFQPVPHMAVYGASKAFVLSFTEAIWAEARPAGVRVVAICPGATDTAFFDVAGEAAALGSRRTPEQVVATTFRALDRGRPTVVDGKANALLASVTGLASRRTVIRVTERTMRAKPAASKKLSGV